LLACSNGCYSQDLILKADGPVPIYTTKDAALSGKASSMRSKGQQVPIRECIDIKHYQIYKVELSAGVIGYVNDGKYTIDMDKAKESMVNDKAQNKEDIK
jgi:hypothetical protein